jgi:hypothetical protein
MVESTERTYEKMQFAIQGITDNSRFAIAIAVGIFGVLTLFTQVPRTYSEQDEIFLFLARITLSVAYWVLILMGLVAHAHHRMYNALLENYIRRDYRVYEDDLKNIVKNNKFISFTVNFLWLNKTSEGINRDYNFITISFFIIAFMLFFFIAKPWAWAWW